MAENFSSPFEPRALSFNLSPVLHSCVRRLSLAFLAVIQPTEYALTHVILVLYLVKSYCTCKIYSPKKEPERIFAVKSFLTINNQYIRLQKTMVVSLMEMY